MISSEEAETPDHNGSFFPAPWPLASRDLCADVKPVDLSYVPEVVAPSTLVAELVQESQKTLASLSSAFSDSSASIGSLASRAGDASTLYGLPSDFAHLRQGLQQQQGPAPVSLSAKQTQRLGTVRLRRVPDVTISPRGSKRDFLVQQSATIFKNVLRKNLDTVFIANLDVPKLLEGEFVMTALHDMQTESSIRGASSNLCQVILNSRLLVEDEARVRAAPEQIIAESDRLLKSLKLSSISLTRAALAVPSFWRQQAVLDCLPAFDQEVRHAGSDRETSDSHQALPVKNDEESLTLENTNENVTDGNPDAGQAVSEPAPSRAENETTAVASRPTFQLKVLADDEDLGTDYLLSDMFLRCDWAGESAEVRERQTLTPQPSDIQDPANALGGSLKKLARPALWELARKKLLVIRDVSMQQALASVDLGKLQAIICQVLGKINSIRLNPAVATHEEVTEACTSFREALWVHTLRYVTSHHTAFTTG